MADGGRADDHVELINLEARYAKCWDQADGPGWADVFTADGVFEVEPVGGRAPFVARGREELAAFCTDFNGKFIGVHLPSLPYIEIDGDEATGHVNFHFVAIGRLASAHTMTRTATGHYEVSYRRTGDGWRMSHRLEKPMVSARDEYFDY